MSERRGSQFRTLLFFFVYAVLSAFVCGLGTGTRYDTYLSCFEELRSADAADTPLVSDGWRWDECGAITVVERGGVGEVNRLGARRRGRRP